MQLPYEMVIGWRYTRAAKSARRNGFISFISGVSMLGIALGVAALIIVLSVMNGFQKEVRDRMLGVLSHLEVQAFGADTLSEPETLLARIRQQEGVVGAAPFVGAQALMAYGETMKGVMLRGIDPAQEAQVTPLAQRLAERVFPRLQPDAFGIVLGSALARTLGVTVGDEITLIVPSGQLTPAGMVPRLRQMTVVGLFDSGHFEYDANMAMMHIVDAQRLFRLEGPTGLRVQLQDLHQAPLQAVALQAELGDGVLVSPWTRQNRNWFAAVQLEKRMMFIILALIVAVAAFNLVSTLVMTVTDKRADIAILRTLGASPASIMAIFMVQGATSGVLGTATGLGLGLLVAFNIGTWVPMLERLMGFQFLPQDIYLISQLPSDPMASDIVPIVVIALVLSFLATLYPSWSASRVKPAEALRYE